MRRTLPGALVMAAALLASSCGSAPSEPLASADAAAPPTTAVVTTTAPPATVAATNEPSTADPVDAICESLTQLSTNAPRDPDALSALYDEIEANAPDDIAPDVAVFIATAREISALIAPFAEGQSGLEEALANADPELQTAIAEMAETASTGQAQDTPFGRVMTYMARHC